MKIDWSFPKQIFIALLVVTAVGSYPLMKYGDREIITAVLIGALLSTFNVLLGFAAIEYSLDKSSTTFFKYVLGGMGVRMLGLAVVLVILMKGFGLHVTALIGSMGIFYVVFLTLEIFYIQKKIQSRQNSNA